MTRTKTTSTEIIRGIDRSVAKGEHVRAGSVQTMREVGERASSRDGVHFRDKEPCLWMTTYDNQVPGGYKGNNVRRTASGAIERLPSVAHENDDYTHRKVHARANTRWRPMLQADGTVASVVYSNAAAHLPSVEGKFSRDGYAQHVINKGLALGWIHTEGDCLLRQIKEGLVNPAKVIARDVLKMKICPKDAASCRHIEAEKTARQAKNAERMAALEEAHRSIESKEADKRDAAIASAVAKALAEHLGAKGK